VTVPTGAPCTLRDAWRHHWPEYLIEAAGLGAFMVSACVFTTLLEHPASPVRQALPVPWIRSALIGVAMALTFIAIVYSPWGKRSGAHINPAATLTFYRLGRVTRWDATCYAAAQFVGGAAGVLLSALVLGAALAHPAVHYAVTAPGMRGVAVAFGAEVVITGVLMTVVLHTAASPKLAPYTGLFVAALVAMYITVESPLSGMSMNPARTFGSAVVAGDWTALWVYFLAPPLGMLLAAQLYLARRGRRAVPCAKLRHVDDAPCHFCEYWRGGESNGELAPAEPRPTVAAPVSDPGISPLAGHADEGDRRTTGSV
jgi:aquaporin Z